MGVGGVGSEEVWPKFIQLYLFLSEEEYRKDMEAENKAVEMK